MKMPSDGEEIGRTGAMISSALNMWSWTLKWKCQRVVGQINLDLRIEVRRRGVDLEVTGKLMLCKAMALGERAGRKEENWGQSLEHCKRSAAGIGARQAEEALPGTSEETRKGLMSQMPTRATLKRTVYQCGDERMGESKPAWSLRRWEWEVRTTSSKLNMAFRSVPLVWGRKMEELLEGDGGPRETC